ncbi:basic leucine zipper 43-like [Impatiens glandulifera]|uniref:basic leucine zipper 43-like n=1 Tax=Impatiens glandulifera TaxID=253017 RepID=UPI001FB0C01F|nr:basic leucine zipper 43-like [Impatiens glandulifera]
MMIPSENNFMINNNPCPFPFNNNIITTMTHNNNNGFFGNFPISQTTYDFVPQPSCLLGYNSTSDETEEELHQQQPGMVDERKKRRMISNRESARRSRMRKQKHLDELCSQVMRLRMENQNLINKLNHVAECHDKVQRENTRLKEEASDLHQMVSDLGIDSSSSPFSLLVADLLEDVNCNTAHLRAESSNQKSMTSSSSLLH